MLYTTAYLTSPHLTLPFLTLPDLTLPFPPVPGAIYDSLKRKSVMLYNFLNQVGFSLGVQGLGFRLGVMLYNFLNQVGSDGELGFGLGVAGE